MVCLYLCPIPLSSSPIPLPLPLPPQDPTSPEAGDLHSRLVQYRRKVKVVRQQSKNEEASDYNLLNTVLRFCLISIQPFSSVHSIFISYSHFSFTDVFAGHGVS